MGIQEMTQKTGLYGFMQGQKTKTALLFVVFMLACQAYAFALMLSFAIVFHDLPNLGKLDIAWQIWRNSTIEVTTTSLLWVFLAYVFQSKFIAQDVGSEAVTRRQEPQAYNLLENLCIATGMKVPSLRVIETTSLNAFSSDLGFGGAEVTLTRGLLNAATKDELEAVLAHQVTRIRNGDSKLIGFAMIFMSMIFRMFEFFIRPFTSFNLRTVFFLIMLPFFPLLACSVFAIVVVVGLIATLATRFAISHSRIYLSDAGTIDLIKDPKPLAFALLKMQAGPSTISQDDLVNAMCIQASEEGWLSSHPTTLSRVEAMAAYAGVAETEAPDLSPRPAFQILPSIRQLHSTGFGTSVSRLLILVPVILAFVGQSWVMAQFGGKIGLVKPLDDSAYVSANPYRQTTTNSLNASDVESQRHCFYNKTTGYITEGKAPVETFTTPDSALVSTADSASTTGFSANRQFHIAGNSAMAAFGPMCAEHGCDSGSFDMFARATFAYYISAEGITTSFQQQSGAAGLAYARQYLNSPADQATRKFIKLATDNKVITEYKLNVAASRLLLNDFANYRACTVEDAKAVNPSLLKDENQPDAQAATAFSDKGTVDGQVKAITQMTKAEVHRQRMNFPLTLGFVLFGIWLVWKVITFSVSYLRRDKASTNMWPATIGKANPATAMLISPLAIILVLISLVFPNLQSQIIQKLGGPAVQVVSSDQDITSHSSMQDRLDARDKLRETIISAAQKQAATIDATQTHSQPVDQGATSHSDLPDHLDASNAKRTGIFLDAIKQASINRQPNPADVDRISQIEESKNCVRFESGFMEYGKAPLEKFKVSGGEIGSVVQRSIYDADFASSPENHDFQTQLGRSFLGQERRDLAVSQILILLNGERCLKGSCGPEEPKTLDKAAYEYANAAGIIIAQLTERSGEAGLNYAYEYLNSELNLKIRDILKRLADSGQLSNTLKKEHLKQLLFEGQISNYRPCSADDNKSVADVKKN